MTDSEMYRVLNDYAKNHTLARGTDVEITQWNWSFKASQKGHCAKYEDVVHLKALLDGAWDFLMWARRNELVRFRRSAKKGMDGGKEC